MSFSCRYLTLLIAVSATVLVLIKVYERSKQEIEKKEDWAYNSQQISSSSTLIPWAWKEAYQQWMRNLEKPNLPMIYVITPTYARTTQKAELTRLSHTLMLVPNLHWIIVEDNNEKSAIIGELLIRSGIRFTTHLNIPTPPKYKKGLINSHWQKPRGVFQRNVAIEWLRGASFKGNMEGVVYFADDDNTYDLQLFEEMRYTKKVSAWPVGLVGGVKSESPLVKDGKITGWMVGWGLKRPFAIDMAGFAINLHLLLDNAEAKFSPDVAIGYVESSLLQMITNIRDIEPKANNCTKVYVWHTRTEKTKFLPSSKLKDFDLKYAHASNWEI